VLRAFKQGGIFIVPYLLWHRASVSGFIRSSAPFCRLFRHTRKYWGPILTRTLTGILW
jgi:hypothetical protein